jgi:hypothetical protein
MAIEYINTGTIANDGTGDALREAFIKVNDNFEELDLRVIETTQFENVGSVGQGVFAGKDDNTAQFKKLIAGTNVTLTPTATTLTLDVDNALEQLLMISDNGSLTVAPGQSVNFNGGNGLTTSIASQTLTIDLDTSNIVSRDSSPTLTANLNANGNDITNAGTITANTVSGAFQGLVYGFDIREFGPYLSGFDFGGMRNTYGSALDFIVKNTDIDLGPIDPERTDLTIDLGFLPSV